MAKTISQHRLNQLKKVLAKIPNSPDFWNDEPKHLRVFKKVNRVIITQENKHCPDALLDKLSRAYV